MTELLHKVFIGTSEPTTAYHLWIIFYVLHQIVERGRSLISVSQSADVNRHIADICSMHPVIKSAGHLKTWVVLDQFSNLLINESL